MLLQNSWEQYKANSKTVLVFALLLVFVLVFIQFQNIFVSSGSIFLDYNLDLAQPFAMLAELGLIALFLVFYSFFVSIIVFSVRRNLSKLKTHFYMREMIQRFTLRIFVFYVLYCLLLFLLTVALLSASVHILVAALIAFVISFLLLFVPQAVVIDEEGLRHAVVSNFEFFLHNPKAFATVTIVGAVMLAVLQLIEFLLGQLTVFSAYISLFLALVFVLPFIEIMKTYMYMLRFDLIKHHEIAGRKKPRPARPEPADLAAAK